VSAARIPIRALVVAWLAAGTLDILAAFASSALRGGTPQIVLKAVASGWMGAPAFRGGTEVAVLGLFLHFFIMIGIVVVFWLAARRLPVLLKHAVISGALYGVAVYAVMNTVVLPLSRIAYKPLFMPTALVMDIAIHMLCVGLPIALVLRHFAGRQATA